MRKRFRMLMIILMISAIAGCSTFSSPSPIAYIHIKGPGNQTKQFVLPLEIPATEEALDLHLSDRYMIKFDLQWLWYEKEDILLIDTDDPEGFIAPLTPWMILKYHF